jgi:asparagine synthase (glutamine-hydrolysing)
MAADVPTGFFLSGGYDSSLITALAQSISNKPIKTFCIGFNEKEKDEAPFAKAVADHLGTDHTELYFSEDEMIKLVDSIPKYYDEPFADSSQIPSMLASELARRNVAVVLTGDAGDEFFCGYNHFDVIPVAQLLDFPGSVTNVIGKLPIGKGKKLLDILPYTVQVIAKNRDRETKVQFGGLNYIETGHRIVGEGLSELYRVENSMCESNWQRRRMLLDITHYLPGDCLCKVDRAAMKYSLVTRCPFLDLDVMEYSFSLQHSFKYKRGNKKRILKDLAYGFVPKELLDRRKTGFGVPLDKWLHGPLRERLVEYSRADILRQQGIFIPEETQKLVDEYLVVKDGTYLKGNIYSKMVWSLFVFQQWYEEYLGSRSKKCR